MVEERNELENRDVAEIARTSDTGSEQNKSRDNESKLVSSDRDKFDAGSSESGQVELAADDDMPAEAEQIKGQIEETRNQMGETIDAIQDKLSFSNLSEQVSEHVNNAVETAKDAVYDATIGKAANFMKNFSGDITNTSIVRTAKNNPFPFVLIGLGAGLLAYQSYTGKGNGKSRRHEFTGGRDRRFASQALSHDFNRANSEGTFSGAKDTVASAAGSVSDAAGTAYNKVSGAVDTAYTGAGEVVKGAYEKVGDLKTTAVEQYDHYINENPLAVGAVALALGAAVGMAIPSTRYEGRMLGEYRQDLMEKAQTTASHLLDKTKDVVTEAGKSISEQARATMTDH